MSLTLYFSMLKKNRKVLLSYGLSTAVYLLIVIATFKSVSSYSGINDFLKQFPEGILNAFGIQGDINKISDYISMQFYSSIFVYILIAFTVFMAVQLISRLVDRGSLVNLLSAPISRSKIALTQAMVLATGLAIIVVAAALVTIISVPFMVKNSGFDVSNFIKLNLIVYALFLSIGAINFLCSCIFNDEKVALSSAFTITLILYSCDVLAKLSTSLDWLKYFTVFTLYKPLEINGGNFPFAYAFIGLIIGSIIIFASSILIFIRKDLTI